MSKFKRQKNGEKGFTLIELLVVAAIIGILLALAIPNLLKARISANEANARKSMQTLRDAEGEYFEQDLNNKGSRDYTDAIGKTGQADSLRDPAGTSADVDALVDSSFETADNNNGAPVGVGGGPIGDGDDCLDPKASYCLSGNFSDIAVQNASGGFSDFGWAATMTSMEKTGRRDFGVYGDGVIRCTLSSSAVGTPGTFEVLRGTGGCD